MKSIRIGDMHKYNFHLWMIEMQVRVIHPYRMIPLITKQSLCLLHTCIIIDPVFEGVVEELIFEMFVYASIIHTNFHPLVCMFEK